MTDTETATDGEVTLAEAARVSGISERTLRRWVKSGKLRVRKVAVNFYLVKLADLPKAPRPTISSLQRQLQEAQSEIERLKALLYRPHGALSGQRNALAEQKPVEVRAPLKPSESHYSAPGGQRPTSASARDLASRPLPDGWVPLSTWAINHGLDRRSVLRQKDARRLRMPAPEYALEGEEWGTYSPPKNKWYPVTVAFRDDQIAEACRVAGERWPESYHPCTDPACPCEK